MNIYFMILFDHNLQVSEKNQDSRALIECE